MAGYASLPNAPTLGGPPTVAPEPALPFASDLTRFWQAYATNPNVRQQTGPTVAAQGAQVPGRGPAAPNLPRQQPPPNNWPPTWSGWDPNDPTKRMNPPTVPNGNSTTPTPNPNTPAPQQSAAPAPAPAGQQGQKMISVQYQGQWIQIPDPGFPQVKESGNGWIKYEDGSYIETGSPAYQKAASFVPQGEEQRILWGLLPWSWKANIAGWDPQYANAYLEATVAGMLGRPGNFQGQTMSGYEAAQKIQQMAGQASSAATANEKRQQKIGAEKSKIPNGPPPTLFINSPYLR